MLGAGSVDTTDCAVKLNVLLPIASVPLYVPAEEPENTTVNVMELPGEMLAGAGLVPVIANPAPETEIDGTETGPIVVEGFVTVNSKFAVMPLPATVLPKLIGDPACAARLIPVALV
jgi:hypothetical protein